MIKLPFRIVFAVLIFSACLVAPAYAYIGPVSVSILFQVIAGAAAFGAMIGKKNFGKIRAFFKRTNEDSKH